MKYHKQFVQMKHFKQIVQMKHVSQIQLRFDERQVPWSVEKCPGGFS
jgi:hypothetical protein